MTTYGNQSSSGRAASLRAMQDHSRQRTISSSVKATGIGLHSGEVVAIELKPAEPNTGIMFRRIDLDPEATIPATIAHVHSTQLSTSLASAADPSIRVATVEHLLSCLVGLGVDNLEVLVRGPELPALDGSSAPFALLIRSAGIAVQDAQRIFRQVTRKVKVASGESYAQLTPADSPEFSYQMLYEDHPFLSKFTELVAFNLWRANYEDKVSRSRTFGIAAQLQDMRSQGKALGASNSNAIAVTDHRILNEGGLRYQDEFQRHKLLDAIGDMALNGLPLLGSFHGHRSGHALNCKLVGKLLASKSCWREVTLAVEGEHAEVVPVSQAIPAV